MNGAKIGLTNIQMKNSDGKFVPICSSQELKVAVEDYEPPKWWQDIDFTKPISIEGTIRAKRKGTLLERSLYYRHSKKRRIRKKYDIYNLFGFRK